VIHDLSDLRLQKSKRLHSGECRARLAKPMRANVNFEKNTKQKPSDNAGTCSTGITYC
jgi:hypothetical protein